MRRAPGAALQRHRIARLLRSIDVYVVLAALAVILYIVVVNTVAASISLGIVEAASNKLALGEDDWKEDRVLPSQVYWPHRWPADPPAAMNILRDGRAYVEGVLARLAPLLEKKPAVHLAAWDLLLLLGQKAEADVTSAALRRVVASVRDKSTATDAAVREAVESAAAVWTAKGAAAEVAEAQRIMDGLPAALPRPELSAAAVTASSWAEWSAAVWGVVTGAAQNASVDVVAAHTQVLQASGRYWSPALDGPLLSLHNRRLLPLSGGTFDAVVPVARLLLQLWVLGDRQDDALAAAYDVAVEHTVRDLVHTRTVRRGPGAMNFTFVAAVAENVIPVTTPRTCALAEVLAQGVRHGVHRRSTRPASMRYTEDDVLQAAEALATSCFQQYIDPVGFKLRGAVYVTSGGPVAGYVSGASDIARKPRTVSCDVPLILLDAFRELHLATEDSTYGLWALLVMTHGASDHCGITARDLMEDGPWLRYVRELRSLWLLMHRIDCLLFRRSHGTRGVCDVTAATTVSPLTGHLRRLRQL